MGIERSGARRWGLGLVVLLAALLVAIGLMDSGGGEHEATSAAVTEHNDAEPRMPPPAGTRDEPPPPGTLAVRVIDETGAAIPGALVCLRRHDSPGVDACHAADASGALDFDPTAPGRYRLTAAAPGFRPVAHPTPGFLVVEPNASAQVTITLRRGRSVEVTGEVRDVAGGPIAGALVSVVELPGGAVVAGAITNDDGEFRVLANPGATELRAVADGYAFGRAQVTVPTGPVTIALIPESVIAGQVIDAEGQAVTDARVEVRPEVLDRVPFPGRAQSQAVVADGRFRFEHLQPGHYMVCASRSRAFGCTDGSISVSFGEGREDVVVRVHEARMVEGQVVVSGRDEPCKEGSVRLVEDATGIERSGDVGEDGSVRIAVAVAGRYGVEVQCRGHASRSSYEPVRVEGADVRGLRWEVDPEDGSDESGVEETGALEGTVTTESGEPLPGMVVVTRSDRTTTNADGRYRLEELSPGPMTVMLADRHGWAMQDPSTGKVFVRDVVIEAGAMATASFTVPEHEHQITGRVIDSDGAPVEAAFVHAIPEPSTGTLPGRVLRHQAALDGAVLTDVDGRFTLTSLQDRKHTVRSFVRGGGRALQSGVAVGSDITLELETETSISGTVAYSDGSAPPSEYRIVAVSSETGLVRDQAFHHGDGRWRVDRVPPGRYHVAVQTRGGRAGRDVEVPESGASGVRLVVEADPDRRPVLVGRVVRLEGGEPLAGFRVVATALDAALSSPRELSDRRNISGTDGRFELPDPPTGRVTVHVFPEDLSNRPPDLTEAHLTVEISAGQGRKDLGDIVIPTRRRIGGAPRGDWGFDVIRWNHDDDQLAQTAEVVRVREGTEAQRRGMVVGDVVTAIDEIDVTGNGRYILWFRMDAPVGATSVFELARGERVELRAE